MILFLKVVMYNLTLSRLGFFGLKEFGVGEGGGAIATQLGRISNWMVMP